MRHRVEERGQVLMFVWYLWCDVVSCADVQFDCDCCHLARLGEAQPVAEGCVSVRHAAAVSTGKTRAVILSWDHVHIILHVCQAGTRDGQH